jgi:hypothetical protein
MAKKPEPPKPTTWTVYKIAAKQIRLGTVEAADEATAIEKAAAGNSNSNIPVARCSTTSKAQPARGSNRPWVLLAPVTARRRIRREPYDTLPIGGARITNAPHLARDR